MDLKNINKILIVKPSSLGDIVHSLPTLYAIKSQFPSSELHWVIAKQYKELLKSNPLIDKLWVIDKDKWKKILSLKDTIHELKKIFANLKKENFDIAIDLQGLLRSGLITYSTNAPVRIGFNNAREGSKIFYTHRIKHEDDIHAVDRYMKVAEFLGCNTDKIIFPLRNEETKNIKNQLPFEKYTVIIPGARWKTKLWEPEKFGELISLLPIKSIIVGSKDDINIANKIVSFNKDYAISLAGKTKLNELIEIINNSEFVISNDSGPMHIASALNIPVVAIFGPTDPVKTGPYGKGHVVIKGNAPCSPCRKKSCKSMLCMNSITVEMVYNAIKERFKIYFS